MTTTYQSNDPRGWGGDPTRGAALGRSRVQDEPQDFAGEVLVSEVEMDPDDEAYDCNGTYWGLGDPLWWVHTDNGSIDYVIRAESVEDAVAITCERWPRASVREGE